MAESISRPQAAALSVRSLIIEFAQQILLTPKDFPLGTPGLAVIQVSSDGIDVVGREIKPSSYDDNAHTLSFLAVDRGHSPMGGQVTTDPETLRRILDQDGTAILVVRLSNLENVPTGVPISYPKRYDC